MDKRYKPIGGMFQGVRGSTVTGGAGQAKKLVILNGQGKVDNSCLPDVVVDAATVAEDLAREIQIRETTDASLQQQILDNTTTLSTSISVLQTTVAENKTEATAAIQGLTALVSAVTVTANNATAAIANIDDVELPAIRETISSLDGRIGSLESFRDATTTDLTNLNTAIATANTYAQTASQQVADLGSRVTTLENDTTTSTAISGLTTRVTTLEGSVSGLDTRLSVVETNSTRYGNDIDALNTFKNNAGTQLTTLNNTVFGVEGGSPGLGTRMSTVETTVRTLENDVSSLGVDVTRIDGTVESMRGTLETVVDNVSELLHDVGLLNTEVWGIPGETQSLGTRISAVEVTVEAWDNTIETIQGSIAAIQENITHVNADYTELRGHVTTIEGRMALIDGEGLPEGEIGAIERLDAKDAEQDTAIAENADDLTQIKEAIDEIYAGIHGDYDPETDTWYPKRVAILADNGVKYRVGIDATGRMYIEDDVGSREPK